MFPTIASTSAGGYGHVRTTYSASGLIMCYPYNADMTLAADTASPYGHYRDNYYGPYKPEELSDAAVTIWMCDGMDMGDVGATGEEIANIDPANPTTCLSHHQVDAGMTRYIRYHHIAGPGSSCTWRLFGCISSYNDENNPPSVFTPWEYYHENPEAVHWDGHVATYSPPGDDNYSAIRKHLTRDATMGRDMTGG
jgi:hypothetical protein